MNYELFINRKHKLWEKRERIYLQSNSSKTGHHNNELLMNLRRNDGHRKSHSRHDEFHISFELRNNAGWIENLCFCFKCVGASHLHSEIYLNCSVLFSHRINCRTTISVILSVGLQQKPSVAREFSLKRLFSQHSAELIHTQRKNSTKVFS